MQRVEIFLPGSASLESSSQLLHTNCCSITTACEHLKTHLPACCKNATALSNVLNSALWNPYCHRAFHGKLPPLFIAKIPVLSCQADVSRVVGHVSEMSPGQKVNESEVQTTQSALLLCNLASLLSSKAFLKTGEDFQ